MSEQAGKTHRDFVAEGVIEVDPEPTTSRSWMESFLEAAGGRVASVEEFEVRVFEVPSSGPVSGITDTVKGVTDSLSGGAQKQR